VVRRSKAGNVDCWKHGSRQEGLFDAAQQIQIGK